MKVKDIEDHQKIGLYTHLFYRAILFLFIIRLKNALTL